MSQKYFDDLRDKVQRAGIAFGNEEFLKELLCNPEDYVLLTLVARFKDIDLCSNAGVCYAIGYVDSESREVGFVRKDKQSRQNVEIRDVAISMERHQVTHESILKKIREAGEFFISTFGIDR